MRINGARQIGTSKVYQVDDAAAVAGRLITKILLLRWAQMY